MADENNEDDSWLYGSSNENQESQDEQPPIVDKTTTEETSEIAFPNESNQDDSRPEEYQNEPNVSSNNY